MQRHSEIPSCCSVHAQETAACYQLRVGACPCTVLHSTPTQLYSNIKMCTTLLPISKQRFIGCAITRCGIKYTMAIPFETELRQMSICPYAVNIIRVLHDSIVLACTAPPQRCKKPNASDTLHTEDQCTWHINMRGSLPAFPFQLAHAAC